MGSVSPPITLYISETCPWAARARIALRETGVKFTEHIIDLKNKPEWYLKVVNPAGLVPAIAYGGPEVPPDQPSRESIKLRESAPIIEWVADAFPSAGLLPADPLLRYKSRIITDVVSSKVVGPYNGFAYRGDTPVETFIKGLETLQAELVPDVKYAIADNITIADAAVAPFLLRVELTLRHDLGVFADGEGKKLHELVSTDPKFKRLWSYIQALKERQSVVETFPEEQVLTFSKQRVQTIKDSKK